MMKRCLQGLTQNPNESFHSRVWRYCPKHINATKTKLEFSVAVATSEYNVGYVASNVNNLLGLEYTQVFDKHLKEKDKMMDRPTRRKMRNKKLQRELDYEAGAHQTSLPPRAPTLNPIFSNGSFYLLIVLLFRCLLCYFRHSFCVLLGIALSIALQVLFFCFFFQ